MLERDKKKRLHTFLEILVVVIALIVFSTVLAGTFTGKTIFRIQSKGSQISPSCQVIPFEGELSGEEICGTEECVLVLDKKVENKNFPVFDSTEENKIIGWTQSQNVYSEIRDCQTSRTSTNSEAVCCPSA